MKFYRVAPLLKAALAAGIVSIALVSAASAAGGKILHTFSGNSGDPEALIADGAGNLYGTTLKGNGSVYRLSPNLSGGWDYSVLYAFEGASDGASPTGLVPDGGGNLYGTTAQGGANSCAPSPGCGTVFKLTPTSSGPWTKSVLYNFGSIPNDGFNAAGIIIDGSGNLYGATVLGGSASCGTVFELTPSSGSWSETVLYNFIGTGGDGCNPAASPIFDGTGNLYGTTGYGGAATSPGYGTVYVLVPNSGEGWTETIIHSFQDGPDGAIANAGLIFDGSGNLYGTTIYGGVNPECSLKTGCGVVFELSPAAGGGWTESVPYRFRDKLGDGFAPYAGVTFDKLGDLYGTTMGGGTHDSGTVFRLAPSVGGGWSESRYSFTGGEDGENPASAVIFDSAGYLYGTTQIGGGPSRDGTVFQAKP
jgi:uncharacterized repeat protein (TIGR03803 family)